MSIFLLINAFSLVVAQAASPQVIWTAVFNHITPLNPKTTLEYCRQHTPSVIVTTIQQITSKNGVKGLNGVTIRYLSYRTEIKDHLYFNLVNAIVSGKNHDGSSWSEPMKLYEQTLSAAGETYTVWSTDKCKGTFLGTPTVIG
ncbi:MAG: hypothetical protein KIT27_02945 [Legionellales bacterium]|nr:hypothetical protein [Legionellales bacterium]